MNAARSVHQKQRHSYEGGILELSVEFGLFDLIGSLSAVHADGRTDGPADRVHRGFNQEGRWIHSRSPARAPVSGLMIHYLFFSAVSSAHSPLQFIGFHGLCSFVATFYL